MPQRRKRLSFAYGWEYTRGTPGASPKRAQGGERGDGDNAARESLSTSITTSTRHTQYRSATWPLGGDRDSLRRRQRKLPVPGSPGRQFRDYLLLQSPEGRTAWARVSAPRREQGKRGLGDSAGESPALCTRLGTGTKAGGRQSGRKGIGARNYYYKEQSRATESHVIAEPEPSRGPRGGA